MNARTTRRSLVVLVAAAAVIKLGLLPVVVMAQEVADDAGRREALQHFRAGQELMSAEQFERAVDEFSTAIDRDPLLCPTETLRETRVLRTLLGGATVFDSGELKEAS